MRKLGLCMCVLACLSWGCTDTNNKDENPEQCEDNGCTGGESGGDTSEKPGKPDEPSKPDEPVIPEIPAIDCPENQLCLEKSELTLYYDRLGTAGLVYNSQENSGVSLNVEGNECAEFAEDKLETDESGKAILFLKAKDENCTSDKKVKVCVADHPDICAEITVHTSSDTKKLDTNGNFMIDAFETNTDKDKYKDKYKKTDCSSYCRDDSDCENFCDSAIGYQCSTRCTRDDQCIKYKDGDDQWKSMICRDDGRCAYPEFKVVYNIKKAGATVTMGGQPYKANGDVTIDWGDGTKEKVPGATNNNLSHTFKEAKKYTVTMTGDYRNWTAGCIKSKGIDLDDVLQFGPIGLGNDGVIDDGDYQYGSFSGCEKFNKLSAADIPDASKLTDMSSMFSGIDSAANAGVDILFNVDKIARWDTSNVKSMYRVFFNTQKFNQDIGRWNVSKVESLRDMFNSAIKFNSYIGCWNVENVNNISGMFKEAYEFNQNLENWKFKSVPKHDKVFVNENGNYGEIGLINYCRVRHLVGDDKIGRESGLSTVNGIHKGSTCCGVSGFSSDELTFCDPGINYEDACDAKEGKTAEEYVNACLDAYLSKRTHYMKVFYNIVKDNGQKLYVEDRMDWRNEPIKDPDTVTCHHLRTCRDCYNKCYTCIQACSGGDPGKKKECEDYCTNITCYTDCTGKAYKACNDKYSNAASIEYKRCKHEAAITCREDTCKDKAPFYDTDSGDQRIDKYCSCEGMAGQKPLGTK